MGGGIGGKWRSLEGVLTPVVRMAVGEMPFDSMDLQEDRMGRLRGGELTLWFRHGAKRIFHVRVVRRGGKTLVELGGGNPTAVLRMIQRCRDHFDRWLGVTPEHVRELESSGGSGS